MKILVCYYSNTGNTKKVAEAIFSQIQKKNHEAEIKSIKKLDHSSLKDYDLVFLGSGIYASRIHKSIIKVLKKIEQFPKKFAFFCTHASLEFYQKPFKKVMRILNKNNVDVIGEFDCVGENIGIPEEQQNAMLEKLPPDQKERAIQDKDKIKGHPDAADLVNAQAFASQVLKKV
ncbi:MAG: hypothetical protein GF317_03175 [Candidatus Lokiarchaeota archaeon]|nr:hypothetical protein [Candidatus Lokiarchaeota archaeon]MBD3198910.1 hypothetical protein [Candidatus Lokiarchaeota archaeon]